MFAKVSEVGCPRWCRIFTLPYLRFILEMAHRKTGNVRLAPDGKMMRDASSPGGTLEGTQTYDDTPQKMHMAWLLNIQEDARAAAGHRKLNSQAAKVARKKAKRKEESGEPARESLDVRALLAGIHLGPPGVGSERVKEQKALSKKVCRAELSAEDKIALNERRKDLRAGQTVQKRGALNARQKAYRQVIMCMCSSCTQHLTHPSFDGTRSSKQGRRSSSPATKLRRR